MPFPTESFHSNDPNDPNGPNTRDDTADAASGAATSGARSPQPEQPDAVRKRAERVGTDTNHLLFGTVEDLLADLAHYGAPDGGVVRVERLVRTRTDTVGGTATLGIAVTARREDEVLSAWVIVGRLALDPWGQPLDRDRARRVAEDHRDAQHLVGALFADAGFDVRLGLYLLPEACYGFAATCTALTAGPAHAPTPAPTITPTPSSPSANPAARVSETADDRDDRGDANGGTAGETQQDEANEPAGDGGQ